MVSLAFSHFSYTVHKVERLLEIWEGKGPRNVVFVDRFPLRNQLQDSLQLSAFHRRHAPTAGNTSLAGEIFWHGCFPFYCSGRISTSLTGHSRTLRVQL